MLDSDLGSNPASAAQSCATLGKLLNLLGLRFLTRETERTCPHLTGTVEMALEARVKALPTAAPL